MSTRRTIVDAEVFSVVGSKRRFIRLQLEGETDYREFDMVSADGVIVDDALGYLVRCTGWNGDIQNVRAMIGQGVVL